MGRWNSIEGLPEVPLGFPISEMLVFEDRLYICRNRVCRLNETFDGWEDLGPVDFSGCNMVVHNDTIYVAGDLSGTNVWKLNGARTAFVPLITSTSNSVTGFKSVVSFENDLYVSTSSNRFARLNVTEDAWIVVQNDAISRCDRMKVFLGRLYGNGSSYIKRLNVGKTAWENFWLNSGDGSEFSIANNRLILGGKYEGQHTVRINSTQTAFQRITNQGQIRHHAYFREKNYFLGESYATMFFYEDETTRPFAPVVFSDEGQATGLAILQNNLYTVIGYNLMRYSSIRLRVFSRDWEYGPQIGVGESVAFEFAGDSDFSPTTFLWDFGDGYTSAEINPTHTFDTVGQFWVTVTVSNSYDSAATSEEYLGIHVTVSDYLTLSFNGNGNTSGTLLESQEYLPNQSVTVPGSGDLAKIGYEFSHWNTQIDNGGNSYSQGDSFNITENTTLYAQWNIVPQVINSYWDVQLSGQLTSDIGEGKTTQEMRDSEEFVGWDFETTWTIDEG